MEAGRARAIRSGIAASLAGLLTFLLAHAAWITPIWFVAPAGAVLAVAGGAAFGAAYGELRARLPRRPLAAPAIIVLVGVIFAPAVIVAEARGPIFAMAADGGGTFLVGTLEVWLDILLGLVATSAVMGAIVGWVLAGTGRAARMTALAAVVLAIGPGHNIPLLGGTGALGTELSILAGVAAVASVVLVESDAWQAHRRRLP